MSADEVSEERARELVRGLEIALARPFPGVRVIERDLRLPGGAQADLVAIDETGRIVLVRVSDGLAEETCLAALDLLAHARAHLKLLASHLKDPQARADLEPRLFLVAEAFSEQLKSRLAPLMADRVLLLEIRELSSASGSVSYLVPLDPPPLASEPRAALVEDFLIALGPDARRLAASAVRRIGRLDHALECSVFPLEVRWRLDARLLASLRRIGTRLEGRVSSHADPVEIADGAALEVFVERTLEAYLELAGRPGEDGEDLPEVDIRPATDGPVLTAEEIRAFQG